MSHFSSGNSIFQSLEVGGGNMFCGQDLGAFRSGIWVVWLFLLCLYKNGNMIV